MSLSNIWNENQNGKWAKSLAKQAKNLSNNDKSFNVIDFFESAFKGRKGYKNVSRKAIENTTKTVSLESIDDVTEAILKLGNKGTDALTKLGNGFKLVGSTFLKYLFSPVGAAVAGALAVSSAAYLNSLAFATDRMNDSFSEFQSSQQEVNTINAELETAQNRINNLNVKSGLTFVEKSELDNLRESVKLLQVQKDLAEQEAQKDAKDSADKTSAAYNKEYGIATAAKVVSEYSQAFREKISQDMIDQTYQASLILRILLKCLRFLQPDAGCGITGHDPVSPGAEAQRSGLHAIRHAAALELLGKEPAVEGFQPFFNGLPVKISGKRTAGHGIDLCRCKTIRQHMVQEEIMQRIGSHKILGLLADLSLCIRRKQFRADGGIQNILQHIEGGRKAFLPGNGIDHPADQRLGNRTVDAVHTHMVAIIGAPAQGQFGKIAGANHNAAHTAGKVHEDLGPFPGLGIFVSGIADSGIMTNIFKMQGNRILNGDLSGLDT